MIHLTRKVFNDLSIWMIGLGLLMGIVFPFFLLIMGIPRELVITPWFFVSCMTAGFIVGSVNIWLARAVVGKRLRFLVNRMKMVEASLIELSRTGNLDQCSPEHCMIEVDSEDELGETSKAFNYLIDALAKSHHSHAAIRSFSEMLTSQLELDSLTTQALQHLLKHMNANAGAFLIASDGEMMIAASYGIRAPETLKNSDSIYRVLQTGTKLKISIPDDVTIEGVLTDFRPSEVLVMALPYKGIPLGVLVLANVAPFQEELISSLDFLCQSMSISLNNALNYDRLQKMAALDPLTGIYNRRFGMARLSEEFSRSVRSSTPLGLIMLDIDYFKKVNDCYGHLAGDRVLIQVIKTVAKSIRKDDISIRYGGEEFLIILPGASKEDALTVSEKIMRMIEDTSVTEGVQVIRVTVSIGVISYPELDVNNEQELVERVDEALYQAKKTGRNKICVAKGVVE